jgi:hypothetical protein
MLGDVNRVPKSREDRPLAAPFPLVTTAKKWAKKMKGKAEKALKD